MKKRTGHALLGLLLVIALLTASACAAKVQAQDLMEGVTATKVPEKQADEAFIQESMRFSLSLLQAVTQKEAQEKGRPVLLSPLSVQYALAMTANGAKGQTLEEMCSVLAGDVSMADLNAYLHTMSERLQQKSEKSKVQLANSIWYKDTPSLHVKQNFLQTNADYYGADAFKAPFDDSTLREINDWVSRQTDGLIDQVLDEIPELARLYLINTLLFDAEWQSPYTESDVRDGVFTSRNGEKREISFLHSIEGTYFDDGKALGFRKMYADRYSFVALLPNEGIDVYDYVSGLTPDGLLQMLRSGKSALVYASLPKFESGYDVNLEDLLCGLGMPTAFNSADADFTDMATCDEGNLYIGRVLHKTFISVGEKGTKAGAATVVEMLAEGAMPPEETVTIALNRPFVYLIMDNVTGLPLFIGVQTDITE